MTHCRRLRIHDWRIFALALLAAAFGGCSRQEIARVSGHVTLDGEPLSSAVVVFENASQGVSVNVDLQEGGAYTAKTYDKAGLPPGTYQVAIRPGSFQSSGEAPLVNEADAMRPAEKQRIPARYQSVATSGLSITVVVGDNPPQDFALTSAP